MLYFFGNNPSSFEERSDSIAARDIFLGALGGFIILFLIIISHINPPTAEDNEISRKTGDLIIFVDWSDELDIDIDVWAFSPKELKPVGYSNREGIILNLLRDDLGFTGDVSGKNFEFMISRGLPEGVWYINLHFYSARGITIDTVVKVKVIIERIMPNKRKKLLFVRDVEMTALKEEITVVSFELDEEGNVIQESVNNDFKSLRGLAGFSP